MKVETLSRLREVEAEILSRTPESSPEPSLDRVRRIMELLGDPQHAFPLIHLTGTNGKTTTTRLVERILRESGLSTGRFTSPHLHDMRERISLNGKPIEAQRFIDTYDDVLPYIQMVDDQSVAEGGPRTTYFEVLTVMAYAAFADAPVDVAIVEVGLGGGWDATNVADGKVAVVTPISLDHTRLLGDRVEDITLEKREIIKAGAIAVVGRQEPEVDDLLAERCEEVDAQLAREDAQFAVTERDTAVGGQQITVQGLAAVYPDLFVPLFGEHQAHNVATAIAAVEAFLGGGEQPLDHELLQAALAEVTSPGRLEIVRRSPTVVVDAAHNVGGMRALRAAIEDSFTFTRLVGLVAILSDKDAEQMLIELEPVLEEIVITRTSSPRAMDPKTLGQLAIDIFGEDRVTIEPVLIDAIDKAVELADEGGAVGGGVLATGSIVTAAEVRQALGKTDT
ncbi:bifunctional folylpolyglutamate synthase/dihydrofolate synthase [Calidifontibacter sp. DB0510]|uniref:tetrahydrofolate synthase n=1 Tax=Metallococcus carri TaxID=1656884 RepID=A0A967B067_9MICO|nr:folylpolyglutamate synthase/dihydrofolate synthase family protein [Metallococcus carri]NHN55898.1 bifunctional folylpolyglutamate synthase/dihydrofolate synthase [Metallococcus carri]NOP38414.1 bifunctional folylpolyglutamate synthase/dihydrofolate synthase [Calidifontibacter sp. DB2511S]